MSLPPAVLTGPRIAQEVGRAAVDRLRRRGGLPVHAADLDASRMSRLLGRRVEAVSVLGGTTGTTDRARLALTGAGVPESVFVKTAAVDFGTRVFGGLARLGQVEVGFYRDVRPELEIDAPRAHAQVFDPTTGRFVIVLEDLAAQGVSFVDTRSPLTPERVAQALSTLARLHGSTAGTPPGWLGSNSTDPFIPLVSAAMPRLGRRVPAELLARTHDRFMIGYRSWARTLDEGPQTVLHGDPHPGNLYLLPDRVGLLDWQGVRRGCPVRDASYNLVLSLPTEQRREHERELLEGYRTELRAAGGPDYTWDQLWLLHRRMVAYAYLSAVFTVGLGGLQGAEVAGVGAQRAGAACDDLDSADALRL